VQARRRPAVWIASSAHLVVLLLAIGSTWSPRLLEEACGCGAVWSLPVTMLGQEVSPGAAGVVGHALLLFVRGLGWRGVVLLGGAIALGVHVALLADLAGQGLGCALCTAAALSCGAMFAGDLWRGGGGSGKLGRAIRSGWGPCGLLAVALSSGGAVGVGVAAGPAGEGEMGRLAPRARGVQLEVFLREGCSYCEAQLRIVERLRDRGFSGEILLHHSPGDRLPGSGEREQELGIVRYPTTLLWRDGELLLARRGIASRQDLEEPIASPQGIPLELLFR
jgi:hypothetical protein